MSAHNAESARAFREGECTPGLPDQRLVVGDWTGEDDTPQARQALAYREADRRLRALYVELSGLRKTWAESSLDGALARAVAYQSVMGTVGHIIQGIERIADSPARPGASA